jgi:hypothetical protein
MRLTAAFCLLLAGLAAGPLWLSSTQSLALAQRTIPCTTNIVNVAAGTTGLSVAANTTYRFAGGVNTFTSTIAQQARSWLCLIGLNGARLRPLDSANLVTQYGNASLFMANLTIDGGTAATAGEARGAGRAVTLQHVSAIMVGIGWIVSAAPPLVFGSDALGLQGGAWG